MNLSIFAESLSELLSLSNLTSSQFADAIGFSRGTISQYLHEKKTPAVSHLIVMANFFNCSIDYLLGRETENYPRVFKSVPPFKERLPELCKDLKISKYRLQKETGIAESAIYNWQRGDCSPKIENLLKIADKFECSVDFIIGRSTI